ncbi:MAG: DUF4785 family protein [Marinilabiliales bacterium]|nr:DUF4785 family protein [Marinilabiliales bacterium]
MSNDALRQRTAELQKEIREYTAEEDKEIQELRIKAESEEDVNLKEELYNQIDRIDKQILEKTREQAR